MEPPKLVSMDEFETWEREFVPWVQAMHYDGWVLIGRGYKVPVKENKQELEKYNYSRVQKEEYLAEKRMISLIYESVVKDILNQLPECETSQKLWNALCDKNREHVEMIKKRKALMVKEFENFTMIKGETLKQVINRYCCLMVEMRKHKIEESTERKSEN